MDTTVDSELNSAPSSPASSRRSSRSGRVGLKRSLDPPPDGGEVKPCRTCHRRKVKCGRELPVCTNCMRLGLECDRRVEKKFKFVDLTDRTKGSSSHSPTSPWGPDYQPPMSYHIAEPSLSLEDISAQRNLEKQSGLEGPLSLSEDSHRSSASPRNAGQISRRQSRTLDDIVAASSSSNAAGTAHDADKGIPRSLSKGTKHFEEQIILGTNLDDPSRVMSMHEIARSRGDDIVYYNHYRNFVVYNLHIASKFPAEAKPFCHDAAETVDAYEATATFCPALYNAILAFAALSLARREPAIRQVVALEYYQSAIKALQDTPNQTLVMMIYTHYFLLCYEIAACEQSQANLEMQHLQRLGRLLTHYFDSAENNVAPQLGPDCQICRVATLKKIMGFHLLADTSNVLMRRSADAIIPDLTTTRFLDSFTDNDAAQWEAVYANQDHLYGGIIKMLVLAGQGQKVIREMLQVCSDWRQLSVPDIREGLGRLDELSRDIATLCSGLRGMPSDIYDESYTTLHPVLQSMYDSVQFMTRMQYIFANTSLYRGQRKELDTSTEDLVQKAASQVLYLTEERWGHKRPIATSNLIALFICGTVLNSAKEKDALLDILDNMDTLACGQNFACASRALRTLYEIQADHAVEYMKDVDWWSVLGEKGMLGFSLYGI